MRLKYTRVYKEDRNRYAGVRLDDGLLYKGVQTIQRLPSGGVVTQVAVEVVIVGGGGTVVG